MQNGSKTHGLWQITAPPPPPTVSLQDSVRADITVIGGGYAGLSAALHLAEAGADVVLIEARHVGFGAAGRNVGLVNAGLWITPDEVVARLGPDYGERLVTLLGGAPQFVFDLIAKHKIACEAERTGTLHCAVGDDGLREIAMRAAQWQQRGAPVVLLDKDATAKKTGSDAFEGALLDQRAGTIQPLAYVRGLAAAAIAAGARVFTDSAALSAERDGKSWTIRTARGAVSSCWVVVATDAYATGPWRMVRDEQVHLPYFNLATAPLPGDVLASILPERHGAWDTRKVLSSFRLDHSGRLIFGSVGALRGPGATAHPRWAKRALHRIFPQLGDISFEEGWYGMIGMTADALPRFHIFDENVIGFNGYNGRGIAPGTVFGSLVASYILGALARKDLPVPPTPIAPSRFRDIKECAYECGALAVHLVSSGG